MMHVTINIGSDGRVTTDQQPLVEDLGEPISVQTESFDGGRTSAGMSGESTDAQDPAGSVGGEVVALDGGGPKA